MINIYLEKHLTNNILKPIFKLEKIESDNSFKKLIKENYLILNDIYNLELNKENEENRPCVCLQMKNMVIMEIMIMMIIISLIMKKKFLIKKYFTLH